MSEDHFGIENEQSASSPSEPTQQQLNENFARTINLLEENRQPHVQRAALHLMCQADSSKRFFPNAQVVRDAMDVFDKDTRTCSLTLSMVKQEVRSGMSVKVFVPKDKSAKEIRDLVSLALPQRWGQRKENVACRTAVASKSYLAGTDSVAHSWVVCRKNYWP